jgi:hypothetical protein
LSDGDINAARETFANQKYLMKFRLPKQGQYLKGKGMADNNWSQAAL